MKLFAKILLSVVLVGGVAAWIGFQWNDTHVFNPDWHPHARFHAVQLGLLFCGLSLALLGLLWSGFTTFRKSILLAASVPLLFWSGEFVALLVPGTNPSPDLAEPNTFSLLGMDVHGNLFFSGVMILLTLVALVCAMKSRAVVTGRK